MKRVIALLSIFISGVLLAGNICGKSKQYQCAEKTLLNEKCVLVEKDENGKELHYISNCGKSETCRILAETEIIGVCFNRLPYKVVRWVGEKCTLNGECITKQCSDGKCIGIPDGGKCNNHHHCSNKSYCNNNGIWEALLKKGDVCASSLDCDFPLICGHNTKGDSMKCMEMFSLENGSFTNDDLLCKSGYADNKESNEDKYCAESTTSVEKCSLDDSSECIQKVTFGTGETVEKNKACNCTVSGKEGYCPITTDKEEWIEYIQTYKTFIQEAEFEEEDNIQHLRLLFWNSRKML